ncbi:MAG: hypothetical protein H3C34_14240 [Caldilineaceae bacterium]|nr:hypothetical protein [Caldilineaceae bacterium]
MFWLRFGATAILVSAVYFAQYIFDHGTLSEFFPEWLLARVPWFVHLTLWRPDDLHTLALWTATISALLFGLVVPAWPPIRQNRNHNNENARLVGATMGRARLARWRPYALTAALGLAPALGLLLAAGFREAPWMGPAWLVAVVLYLGAATSGRVVKTSQRVYEVVHPEQGWRPLLVVLAVVGLSLGWDWTLLPIRIDESVARFGLQAQTWLEQGMPTLFQVGETGAPAIAYLPLMAAMALLRDALAANQVVGMVAGLATVLAAWLVGCELFRRRPEIALHGRLRQDDGRRVALLGAALTGVGVAMLHFGRMAPLLPATAAGTVAAWMLLRGLRRGGPGWLAAAGVVTGLAVLLDRSGLIFPVLLALWWLGLPVLQRAQSRQLHRLAGLAWWGGGLLVTLAPLLGLWLRVPGAFNAYWSGAGLLLFTAPPATVDLWANIQASTATLIWLGDNSRVFGYPGPLLHPLFAPLFMLAAGVLVVNLDRVVGWCLLTWLGVTIVMSASMNGLAPAWPTLLPLLPAVGLAMALGLDRLRLIVVDTLGPWTALSSSYVAVALVTVALLSGWLAYSEYARLDLDMASLIGRELRAAQPGEAVVQVAAFPESFVQADNPVVRFIAGEDEAATLTSVTADALPELQAARARLLVLPADSVAVAAVQAQYPQARLETVRDLHGNPLLYRFLVF